MKIYYEDSGWNLIGAIIEYPNIKKLNNMYGSCTVALRDFEVSNNMYKIFIDMSKRTPENFNDTKAYALWISDNREGITFKTFLWYCKISDETKYYEIYNSTS